MCGGGGGAPNIAFLTPFYFFFLFFVLLFLSLARQVRFRKALFFMLAFSFLTICDRGVYGSWSEMIFIAAVEILLLFGCMHKLADEVIVLLSSQCALF